MKYYLFLILLCFHISSYGQSQRNYAQELFNLLMNGRIFEAREFKLQHRDQLRPYEKVVDLVYNMHMSIAFDKPDSTIIYFEEFLRNSYNVHGIGPIVSQYYVRLCETYESKQQFDKAISTVERHINYLEENPYSLSSEVIQKEIGEAQNKISSLKEKLDHEPIISILRDNTDAQLMLKESSHIRFDALYNGQIIETFFDTGVSEFCIMEKGLADEIGVKYYSTQDSLRIVNGKRVKAIEGYIDSIELKGIKLYNIPVGVFLDKFSSHLSSNINPDFKQNVENSLLKSRQIIFGLPAMKMIGGRFVFDWKANTLVIQQTTDQKPVVRNSNIAFFNNTLYLKLKIHETDFTGFLDLGSDNYLYLTYPYFFKANCSYVKYDSTNQPFIGTGFVGGQENVESYRVDNPQIYFNGKKIENSKLQREVFAVSKLNNFDGEVGISFFKKIFSKTVIDFNKMTIECED